MKLKELDKNKVKPFRRRQCDDLEKFMLNKKLHEERSKKIDIRFGK